MTSLEKLSLAIKDHLLGSGIPDALELHIDCMSPGFDIILSLPDADLAPDDRPNPIEILRDIACVSSVLPINTNTYQVTLVPEFWQEVDPKDALSAIRNKIGPIGDGRMNVEFVSAYPTGPLRHEHFQCGVFGDVVARIYEWAGWDVSREFYVNDIGLQAETNARVLQAFALSQANDETNTLPPEISEYLTHLLAAVKTQFGAHVFEQEEQVWLPQICAFSVEHTLSMFTEAMTSIGIRFDTFAHEKTLLRNCDEPEVLNILSQAGALQSDGNDPETLTIRLPGNDAAAERTLRSKNQTWTYVFSDVILHHDKLKRGFDGLVTLLNAQHAGYEKFIGSIVELLAGERQPFFRARALKPFNESFQAPAQSGVGTLRWAYLTAALPAPETQPAQSPDPEHELSRLLAIWPDVLGQITTTCEVEYLAAFAGRLAMTLGQCDALTTAFLTKAGEALLGELSAFLGVEVVHFQNMKPTV